MTEPQTWAMLGVFTTIMLGGMTLMTTLINRATVNAIGGVRGEMDGLRGEIGGRITALEGEIGGRITALEGEVRGLRGEMNARFERVHAEMDARFTAVDARIGHLDRDVSVIVRRLWGEPQGE